MPQSESMQITRCPFRAGTESGESESAGNKRGRHYSHCRPVADKRASQKNCKKMLIAGVLVNTYYAETEGA